MLRPILFWGAIALGVPCILGEIVQFLLAIALEMIIGQRWKVMPSSVFEFIAGVVTSWAAGGLSVLLGVPLSILVPLMLAGLISLWLTVRRETEDVLPQTMGIATGYGLWLLVA